MKTLEFPCSPDDSRGRVVSLTGNQILYYLDPLFMMPTVLSPYRLSRSGLAQNMTCSPPISEMPAFKPAFRFLVWEVTFRHILTIWGLANLIAPLHFTLAMRMKY